MNSLLIKFGGKSSLKKLVVNPTTFLVINPTTYVTKKNKILLLKIHISTKIGQFISTSILFMKNTG